jgi:hypothetical protein
MALILVKAKKEKELQEQIFLEEMDEETYNNLPYEKRKEIDDRLLETKKLRLKRYHLKKNCINIIFVLFNLFPCIESTKTEKLRRKQLKKNGSKKSLLSSRLGWKRKSKVFEF